MKLVLIVEDEHGAAEVLQLLLESHEYRVVAASNGNEALVLLGAEKPSVILSDFMMPHMNGAELGVQVRRDPLLRDIPFVFVSGTNEAIVKGSFKDYDGFISKPYEVDAMLALLDKLTTNGRLPAATSAEIDDSMRQLLKGIELPPDAKGKA
jgi:two-component system phosphate regulon response regulator PhoB